MPWKAAPAEAARAEGAVGRRCSQPRGSGERRLDSSVKMGRDTCLLPQEGQSSNGGKAESRKGRRLALLSGEERLGEG